MFGEKERFTSADLRECAKWNDCPIANWEHTSNGYWMILRFENDEMEFDFYKVLSFLDDLERNGLTLVYKNSEMDSDGEDTWNEYEIEIMF